MKREIFVSPAGFVHWTGRYPEPTADGLDGPMVAPQLALRRARQWHNSGESDGPVTVWLDEGRYPITFPMTFGPEDCGVVEFKARPGTSPVIDGGARVAGWEQSERDGRPVWTARVSPHVREFGPFRSLFVNGTRRKRARYPAGGYLWIEEAPDAPTGDMSQTFILDIIRGGYRFRAAAGDLDRISSWEGAEIILFNRWINERMAVASYDPDTRMVNMSVRTCLFLRTDFESGGKTLRYYVENVPEGLIEPGDWYLDEKDGLLTYLPMEGETPDTCEVVIPVVKQFIRIKGDMERDIPAGGIRFEGIGFEYADWSTPCNRGVWWDPYAPESAWRPRASWRHFVEGNNGNPHIDTGSAPQAAASLPGTIHLECARDVAIVDCRIAHIGFYGIGIGEACRHIRVIGNEICDMGGGGILVDGTDQFGDPRHLTGQCRLTDNHIHGGGHVFRAACGIAMLHSARNVAAHNHIHDMTYSGISCGWNWGVHDSPSLLHWIYKNHIHDLGRRGGMSDMGGIYLLGPQPGTFVEGNYIHDVTSAAYGGWGIYPDEGSSMLTIENNVIVNTGSESFFEHMGRQNVIRNNMFLLGGKGGAGFGRGPHNRWLAFPTEGGLFLRNIIVTDGACAIRDTLGYQSRNPHEAELNTYWNRSGETFFSMHPRERVLKGDKELVAISWADRRASGLDRSSQIADPLLADIENGDFTLAAGSPALAIGFRPITLSDVGPRPPAERVRWHEPEPKEAG